MKKTYYVKKAKIVLKMANDSNKTKRPKYRLSRKCSFYIHDKHICEVKSFSINMNGFLNFKLKRGKGRIQNYKIETKIH